MAGIIRRKAGIIKVGNIYIGGINPVAIQSMLKNKTAEVEKSIRQIKQLELCGCEIVRVAIKDIADAKAIKKIKQKIKIPIVADIHFNWRLAIEAIDNGADKIRLNPGNIYKRQEIKEIVRALKFNKIPLRIGVNSGSLRRLNSKKSNIAQLLVVSALNYVKEIEKLGFYDMVLSLKASNALDTIEAYRKIAGRCEYPLHLGLTATGLPQAGMIKSAIALGVLLLEGIGDTIRVSLTEKPQQEVKVARAILETLGLRCFNHRIISCPTCGRCEVDLIRLVKELEHRLLALGSQLPAKPLKIAVMGCVVNGPGEAKEADLGIAFGKKDGLLFKEGKIIRKISSGKCVDVLLEELTN